MYDGFQTQGCCLSLGPRTELPTPDGTAKGHSEANVAGRRLAPRGPPPFVTRCCSIPVYHLTSLLSRVDFRLICFCDLFFVLFPLFLGGFSHLESDSRLQDYYETSNDDNSRRYETN